MRKLLFVLLAGSLFVAAPAASARRRVIPKFLTYRVVFEGSGSYTVNGSDPPASNTTTASFHWKAVYRPLLYISSRGAPASTVVNQGASSGSGDWKITNFDGTTPCSESGGLALAPGGGITGASARGGALNLRLVPGSGDFTTTGASSGSGACDTSDFWHDWIEGFSHVGGDDDPLTAFVHLSARELRAGKDIINVSNVTLAAPDLVATPDCGSGDGATCAQTFSWKGVVTITKVKQRRRR